MKYSSGRVERRKAPHKGWRAVLDYEEGGKRKRKTRSLDARTKTEANRQMNAWWAEMEAEAERRAAEPPTPAEEASSVTVGEWVSDQIAQMGAVGSITPTTVAGYRHSAKLLSPIAGTPWTGWTGPPWPAGWPASRGAACQAPRWASRSGSSSSACP